MSWAADEWKDGLLPLALQKIFQLEIQVAKFRKDSDEEQCRLDIIEVAFQTQKKRTEDEKTANAQLSRDMKVMADSHEDMQKKVDKMQHDLSVKDGTILNLEGTVTLNKAAIEGEHEKSSLVAVNFLWKRCGCHSFESQIEESRLNAEVSRMAKELSALESSKQDLTEKRAVMDGVIHSDISEMDVLKRSLEQRDNEKVLLGKKLEASLQECEQLSIELQKLKDTVGQRLERNEHLMAVVIDRDLSLEKAHDDNNKLTIKIAGQEKELSVLKSEMDTLKTNFVAVTSSLDQRKLHMHEEIEKISNEHSNHIIQQMNNWL